MVCPICGKRLNVKAMGVHLEGHVIFEPDRVEAWRTAKSDQRSRREA